MEKGFTLGKHKQIGIKNVYAAQFNYQELFSRLLKLQNQRKLSENMLPGHKKHSSHQFRKRTLFESNNTKQTLASKLNFNSTSTNFAKTNKKLVKNPLFDTKKPIFRSFSPFQVKKMISNSLQKSLNYNKN